MFAKAYLEITNVCNLRCSFCPGSKRPGKFLSPDEFAFLAEKLRPHTDYLYLHVMGEPLLHPNLDEILTICAKMNFRTVITTNGVLLKKCREMLLSHAATLYKISVSLHSFEANDREVDFSAYLDGCIDFISAAAKKNIISVLRLWNLDGAHSTGENTRNAEILSRLHIAFPGEWREVRGGPKMADHCYLEWGERFLWPSSEGEDYGEERFCMALRDQIGVLSDGTVIPCCLDSDGALALGNLFTQSLEEILQSERARRLVEGFSQRRAVEDFCRRCEYACRFTKN